MKPGAEYESHLVIGWTVSRTREPKYWTQDPEPVPGNQQESDLTRIPTSLIAAHTAIIAQSGSGKSFFLGRIIEEILVQSRSNCLVLDPNADFRWMGEIKDARLWDKAKYHPNIRRGKLPHEKNREEFASKWIPIRPRVRSNWPVPERYERSAVYDKLQIRWTALDIDIISDNIPPVLRSELFHCHEFVKAVEELLLIATGTSPAPKLDILDESLRYARIYLNHGEKDLDRSISKYVASLKLSRATKDTLRHTMEIASKRLKKTAAHLTHDALKYYFAKAAEIRVSNIVNSEVTGLLRSELYSATLDIVDLPSLPDKKSAVLVANAVLASKWDELKQEWSRAAMQSEDEDTRCPTFIVVDEAHNLIPKSPQTPGESALLDQFRKIVAEGRKYGLFLVLVSQRPDKLDPLVLSECENVAIMRLSSEGTVNLCRDLFGLSDLSQRELEKCLDFEIGRAMIAGKWANGRPEITYGAARRTKEGGRNLQKKHWARPRYSMNSEDTLET